MRTDAPGVVEPAIAFLGYPVTRSRARQDPTVSLADNRMQHGYLRALDHAFASVTAFSSLPADDDAPSRDSSENGIAWRHVRDGGPRALRPALKLVNLYRELGAWARGARGRDLVLVHYNTFLLYALVAAALRVRHGVRVVPIAITLPYRSPDARISMSARVQDVLSRRLLRNSDSLIAISPFLGELIAPGVPTLVVRGAVDGVPADHLRPAAGRAPDGSPRRIVYAGNLTERYQLEAALAMMSHLPSGDFELHLYGRGALEHRLRAAAESTAVHLHGVVDEAVLPLVLAEADVLLALLRTDDHLAKYSFPSKLFESLASGTPTVTTDLATLDPEMRKHLVVVDSVDPRDLADTVETLCRRSAARRVEAAAAALTYLRDHATWSAVGDQVHRHLTRLEDGTP